MFIQWLSKDKTFKQTFRMKPIFIVLIAFVPFFYPLRAHSGFWSFYPLQKCWAVFSSRTPEPKHDINPLINRIEYTSPSQAVEILKQEEPKTLRILIEELFSEEGMTLAKYKLLSALGEIKLEDPDTLHILFEVLLSAEAEWVKQEVASVLRKSKTEDSKIQRLLAEMLSSEEK